MDNLFNDDWMKSFQDIWNGEPELKDALAQLDFNSAIGYGVPGEDKPRGFISVVNGEVIDAGAYSDEALNWDIRAEEKNWGKWLNSGIGMAGMGMAVTTGKMKFKVGDFKAMIKDPRMAGPFVKSFEAMGRV
ncbi:SCP-2 sterol transfer family protein [sulfur-oxidizing endosymbiont of Gigantopelta aegis]|uniref:SCP-2 sterol transfer family protein n=1 Tax=sulfur-oxidizing endosymbiont of Gigantopelta aegis TaxID=2794934 RepID=UPI0018DC60CB|nr:SCP-2 sterol transfer family protein [sulfur-oxidizing endosymbiont of Gigantopelta aegis]